MKIAFRKIKTFIEERTERVSFLLAIFGLISLLVVSSLDLSAWPIVTSLLVNMGTASVVSGIAFWVMSLSSKKIERTIENGIINLNDDIVSALSSTTILGDTKECGILRIFKSRRDDGVEILNQLMSEFEYMPKNSTISIMAISLRDFILGDERKIFIPVIRDVIVKNNIKVRLLLLDPTSKCAKDRAVVEEPVTVEKEGYSASSLFIDLMRIIDFLANPPGSAVPKKVKNKVVSNIDVRFYPFDPTTFIVDTDRYTFLEQYHRGGDDLVREELEKKDGIRLVECFAGFTPVLMLDNRMRFSNLLMSHFDNIWNSKAVIRKKLTKKTHKEFCNFKKELIFGEKKLREQSKNNATELLEGYLGHHINRRHKEKEYSGNNRRITTS